MICTDSMARGMDVENVKYIISYERPLYIKTYIHRVGRTARAGKVGIAITLLERKEVCFFLFGLLSFSLLIYVTGIFLSIGGIWDNNTAVIVIVYSKSNSKLEY